MNRYQTVAVLESGMTLGAISYPADIARPHHVQSSVARADRWEAELR